MKTNYVKFNMLTEARKVLKGKPTKVDRESLLHVLAADFVAKRKSKA